MMTKQQVPAQAQRKQITIHVNERAVPVDDRRLMGVEIKQAAIDAGVRIELDFILVEELRDGQTRVVGDRDEVRVNRHSRFLANDGDDDS
jgi:hypothetical protein